jgi:hypothetical protein
MEWAKENNVPAAFTDTVLKGGAGGTELANLVLKELEKPNNFHYLYPLEMPVEEKIRTIAKEIYGVADIRLTDDARTALDRALQGAGYRPHWEALGEEAKLPEGAALFVLGEQVWTAFVGAASGTLLGTGAALIFVPFLQVGTGAHPGTPPFLVTMAWNDVAKLLQVPLRDLGEAAAPARLVGR